MTSVPSLVRFAGPREVQVVEYPDAPLGPRDVRLTTLYSGISAGTELTAYRGSNPYLTKSWDPGRRLFVAGDGSGLGYPLDRWGYEEVGRIEELGSAVDPALAGQLVYGAWGHASSHVAPEGWAADRLVPPGVAPIAGTFARSGAIALNAVLDADVNLGETVAVFGQGVLGLLVTRLCVLASATVVAVDRVSHRLDLARQFGAHHVIDAGNDSPAERIRELTDGRGADVSVEVSGSYAALQEAIRSTAYNSQVVTVGFLQGGDVALRLGEEFHHNRIQLTCSQISGVNRRLDHRWTRERLEQTVMRFVADDRLAVTSLVSHVMPVERAGEAFAMLDRGDAGVLQVVLAFAGEVAR
ncbi:zinc-binding alcohol dehydrogenase [soil metagenome]